MVGEREKKRERNGDWPSARERKNAGIFLGVLVLIRTLMLDWFLLEFLKRERVEVGGPGSCAK